MKLFLASTWAWPRLFWISRNATRTLHFLRKMGRTLSVVRPYRRTWRPFSAGVAQPVHWQMNYVRHPRFAKSPQQYIRAFLLLQKDLLELFDFVEPADVNLTCYSFRIHELLTRTCIEIEANFKAILAENGYSKRRNWNMGDYKKLDATHHLSSYRVKAPQWNGRNDIFSPFSAWTNAGLLTWYDAYNLAKHDRHQEFGEANLCNLLNAICGLVAILASQFHTEAFLRQSYLTTRSPDDGWELAIGDYFLVSFPSNWLTTDRYEFIWNQLDADPDPFQHLTF